MILIIEGLLYPTLMKLCHHIYFGINVRNDQFLTFDLGNQFEPDFHR